MERVLRWLKSILYEKKNPEEVVIRFRLPDGKEIDVTAIQPVERPTKCVIHPDYTGATEPTTGCNICWEICSQKKVWSR